MHHPTETNKWVGVLETAAVNNEPFDNVNVITAKGEYVKLAYGATADALSQNAIPLTPSNVAKAACQMIASNKVHVHEYIKIDETGVSACVNVDDIEHEAVTWRVMDMMSTAMNSLNGSYGVVRFGPPLRFTLAEVPWAISEDFALQSSALG